MIYEKKYKKPLTYFLILVSILFIVCSLSTVSAANKTITSEDEGGIRDAINNGGVNSGDTIFLQPGTYNKTGKDTNFTISKSITIQGNGSTSSVIIDAKGISGIFTMGGGINVKFINITFINGNSLRGGAIFNNYVSTNMIFISCTFINNTANSSTIGYGGGAIYNNAANLTVTNSNFIGNTANRHGGAIYNNAANITVKNSTFFKNNAKGSNVHGYGGAIYNHGNGGLIMIIENSNFTENEAEFSSGAIFNDLAKFTVTNSNFTGNIAGTYGGAIDTNGNFTVNNSNFIGNTASKSGGAIYSCGVNFTVNNSKFINNTGSSAIYNINAKLTVTNSYFTGNIANEYGGAIFNSAANFTVINSYFTGNIAGTNGGAIANTGTNSVVSKSTFTGNIANNNGGGIHNQGNMSVFGNIMTNNKATLGNVIYNTGNMGGLTLTYLNNGTINVVKGQTVTLFATLTDDMGNVITGKNISFIVNGTTIRSVTFVEGYANISYNVPDFKGLLSVSGNYTGYTNYQITLLNGQLRAAIETNSTINTPNDVKVGQKVNITGTATDKDGNPIVNTIINVIVNGKSYTVTTDNNGVWILPYTLIQAGNINVSVQWDGNDTLFGFISNTSFYVEKSFTNSTINTPNDVKVGQKINITGVAKDEFGNILANAIISVVVNGKSYTVTTDGSGIWALSYTPTQAGNIDVFVIWEGNDNYFSFITSISFDVDEVDSNLTDENETGGTSNSTVEEETTDTPNSADENRTKSTNTDINNSTNTKNSVVDADMKNSGMPIIAMILLILTILGTGLRKRK